MINIGIIGATGYTGLELVRLVQRHPAGQISFLSSRSQAGKLLSQVHPAGPPLPLIRPEDAPLDAVDVVFLCLPHAASIPAAVQALDAGARVIDLSADFRLRDPAVYAQWYGQAHAAPELLAEAVYGLTEYARDELPAARLVANPGCYPTTNLLALGPVLQAGAAAGTIIADAKSGVSGAGRTPKQHTHFVEVADNFSPYKIGRVHRHVPEIEQGLRRWQPDPPALIFAPHLLPVPRGILATIYVPLRPGWDEERLRAVYEQRYQDEPFVQVLPAGEVATLAHVNHTNHCVIGLTVTAGTLILTAALDNLVKGAAGQAVQNMNVMFGRPETEGLL